VRKATIALMRVARRAGNNLASTNGAIVKAMGSECADVGRGRPYSPS